MKRETPGFIETRKSQGIGMEMEIAALSSSQAPFSQPIKADVPSPHRQNRHTYFARATAVVAALQVYLAVVFVNANVCFVKFYRFKNFHKHQRMSATCLRHPRPTRPSAGPTASPEAGPGLPLPLLRARAARPRRRRRRKASWELKSFTLSFPRRLATRGLPIPQCIAERRRGWRPEGGSGSWWQGG